MDKQPNAFRAMLLMAANYRDRDREPLATPTLSKEGPKKVLYLH